MTEFRAEKAKCWEEGRHLATMRHARSECPLGREPLAPTSLHPTVSLPAMFEGPRVPTTYKPTEE